MNSNAKYTQAMLANPADRKRISGEISNKTFEFKVKSVKETFCLVQNPDFAMNLFLSFKKCEINLNEGDICTGQVRINKDTHSFSVIPQTVRLLSHANTAAPQKSYSSRKPLNKPGIRTAANNNNASDFFHTREEFFKSCRMGKDEAVFAIYLNTALTNICNACGLIPQDEFQPVGIKKHFEGLPEQKVIDFAHFLFLFASQDKAGYKDNLRGNCEKYVEKIVELRNFFSHYKKPLEEQLRISDELYPFLGKISMEAVSLVKKDAQAVAATQLFRKIPRKEGLTYKTYHELTREGIIFLCCMGLYADEAHDFCSQLNNLKMTDIHGQGLRQFFSAMSMRRGRQMLNATDADFMIFADIIAYLNKVPTVSLNNLSLKNERERMEQLQEQSQKNEAHKSSKFLLQERVEEKFVSFAISFIEDFKILPHFAFKHLDTEHNLSRDKYSFSKIDGKKNPLNRHFTVDYDSAHFEWKFPAGKEHYGAIKINALRGIITQKFLQQILYLSLNPAPAYKKFQEEYAIDQLLDKWLTAYHALLEKLLNCTSQPDPASFQEELSILLGTSIDMADESLRSRVIKVIGQRLTDYIFGPGNTTKQLRAELLHKAEVQLEKDIELEKRFPKERIPDGLMIRQVFRFFNFLLEKTPWQFRQLPLSKQHRGALDYEYQTIHALIGKYTADPKALWKYFRKTSEMKAKKGFAEQIRMSAQDAVAYCNSRENLVENSKILKRTTTLENLAFTALKECIRKERELIQILKDESASIPDMNILLTRYNIKTQKTFSQAAAIGSILKIDTEKWENAFDYDNNAPYSQRSLVGTGNLIVPQITFRDDLLSELFNTPVWRIKLENDPKAPWDAKNQKINFQNGIHKMTSLITLRDYYDVSTLTKWLIVNSKNRTPMPVCPEQRNAVDEAYRTIRKTLGQDQLLLAAAFAYRNRFVEDEKNSAYFSKSEASLYELFSNEFPYPSNSKQQVMIRLNDLNKPALVQMLKDDKIMKALFKDEPADRIPSFEEFSIRKKQIDAMDRKIRRFFILPVMKFYDDAPKISHLSKPEGMSNKQWEDDKKWEYIADALQQQGYAVEIEKSAITILIKFRNALLHDHFNLLSDFDLGNSESSICNALLQMKLISFSPDFLQQ